MDRWNAGKIRTIDANDLLVLKHPQGETESISVDQFLSNHKRFGEMGSPEKRKRLLSSLPWQNQGGKGFGKNLPIGRSLESRTLGLKKSWDQYVRKQKQKEGEAKRAIPGETRFTKPLRAQFMKGGYVAKDFYVHEPYHRFHLDLNKQKELAKTVRNLIDDYVETHPNYTADEVMTFMETLFPRRGKDVRDLYEHGSVFFDPKKGPWGTVYLYFPTTSTDVALKEKLEKNSHRS